MDIKVGDRVYVKHNHASPYRGFKGEVVSIDEGLNFPIEVKLEGVEEPVVYTEPELRAPKPRAKKAA